MKSIRQIWCWFVETKLWPLRLFSFSFSPPWIKIVILYLYITTLDRKKVIQKCNKIWTLSNARSDSFEEQHRWHVRFLTQIYTPSQKVLAIAGELILSWAQTGPMETELQLASARGPTIDGAITLTTSLLTVACKGFKERQDGNCTFGVSGGFKWATIIPQLEKMWNICQQIPTSLWHLHRLAVIGFGILVSSDYFWKNWWSLSARSACRWNIQSSLGGMLKWIRQRVTRVNVFLLLCWIVLS